MIPQVISSRQKSMKKIKRQINSVMMNLKAEREIRSDRWETRNKFVVWEEAFGERCFYWGCASVEDAIDVQRWDETRSHSHVWVRWQRRGGRFLSVPWRLADGKGGFKISTSSGTAQYVSKPASTVITLHVGFVRERRVVGFAPARYCILAFPLSLRMSWKQTRWMRWI